MADLLVRNVDEAVVRRIDAAAERQGLSRNEFLRREVGRVAEGAGRPVTHADLRRMADVFADAEDPEVMDHAWR